MLNGDVLMLCGSCCELVAVVHCHEENLETMYNFLKSQVKLKSSFIFLVAVGKLEQVDLLQYRNQLIMLLLIQVKNSRVHWTLFMNIRHTCLNCISNCPLLIPFPL